MTESHNMEILNLLFDWLISKLPKCTDSSWSSIEFTNSVLRDYCPETIRSWISRNTFKLHKTKNQKPMKNPLHQVLSIFFMSADHYTCGGIRQRTICDIRVAGDPTNVSRAPENIIKVVIKRVPAQIVTS